MVNNDKAVAYFCDCVGPHKPDCYLGHRLKIKYDEISSKDYLDDPEGWEKWIDKELEKRIKKGLINVSTKEGLINVRRER